MSTHTPGPWEISEQYIIARSARGLRTICQWGSYSDEPNARLIKAAPDLLAELKWIAGRIDRNSGSPNFTSDEYDRIRAAIAKAEGTP